MRLFNDGWLFAKNSQDNFKPVEIPHDWLICDVKNLHESSCGFYKKTFYTDFSLEGKRVLIYFDGVMMDCELYVNDSKVGEWKYGYTAFEFDITDYLIALGENTILLKVNYRFPCSRWYTGAGIYRDVFLIEKNTEYFKTDGVYITPKKQSNGTWIVDVKSEVVANGLDYETRHQVVETGNTTINNALIWDIDSPNLYHLKSELIIDGIVKDTFITRFGLRETAFKPNEGFFLNNRKVKLKGVCVHQDLGALGVAVNKDAIKRQLVTLREMGVNAIRTAHNPPSRVFMELCDETGFLVLSEVLDMWQLPKNKYDYAHFFDEWIERDIASWIRRDRNCPSVIMWSIGNEISDTHADFVHGESILRKLVKMVQEHDPNCHAPITLCSNYMLWENTQKCMDILKLAGYNYTENLYEEHHAAYPDWVIYGSETFSTTQSRSVYHFPLSKSVLADDDLQCSALGNCTTSWGTDNIENCLLEDNNNPYSMGQFIWAGQDYIGEPTPYHTKNSYLGHIDTAGFPKDSFYIIKAAWTDEPMVHLFPYWDFSPGQPIDVRVCSNMPKVELFLNGISLGIKELGSKLIADWCVNYESGEIRAVAYDFMGNAAVEDVRFSFGDAVSVNCDYELSGDLLFVSITVTDANGCIVENANNRVYVNVEDGVLLGLDNGDATDYEQYQGVDNRCLFNGKLLAIVKPYPEKTARVNVRLCDKEIPVRKIELTICGFDVNAKVYPANATYRDLCWRLTDVGGIESHLGEIDVSSDLMSAKIIPNADGDVYIRCGAKNGREHVTFYTYIIKTITGLGKKFLSPFDFISGGLYTFSNVALTNGNERGVATLYDGDSYVCFSGLDFGDNGSDEVTLGLFPLSNDPFKFEIWEGIPQGGGKFIMDAYYDKGSTWNTYTEVSYKLPRRLRGVTGFSLVFRQKVHIKGFRFSGDSNNKLGGEL